ncbi:DNA-binding transcriptional regulator Fis [Thalassotalea euphylliae]|uniref:Putative Fis-like DNA-binding protein n=1 Tax=Thalassotalea euphylliae TaxID=1655234 RepID=A0A3E0U4V2_9GAMM|nr:DNA-binding transcriptional regulator Fis [Thalassotalea euphylliae]REL25318.1 DNA-binding transcriptional regulator Fis [Thalassotalea euphylliae]REL31002.1 DNA-binding transcriptional regulator Fis [Thalassotalea euphylliae]REL34091.1 DNA-binding transcriptional regulator Fis [Thalassotalea euphylliae]
MFEQNISSPFITNVTDIQQQTTKASPLRTQAKIAIKNYLSQLNGNDVDDMYELVLSEIEAPMLEEVMTYTRGNQTRAANLLGINRGTLRKKLKKYGMN